MKGELSGWQAGRFWVSHMFPLFCLLKCRRSVFLCRRLFGVERKAPFALYIISFCYTQDVIYRRESRFKVENPLWLQRFKLPSPLDKNIVGCLYNNGKMTSILNRWIIHNSTKMIKSRPHIHLGFWWFYVIFTLDEFFKICILISKSWNRLELNQKSRRGAVSPVSYEAFITNGCVMWGWQENYFKMKSTNITWSNRCIGR